MGFLGELNFIQSPGNQKRVIPLGMHFWEAGLDMHENTPKSAIVREIILKTGDILGETQLHANSGKAEARHSIGNANFEGRASAKLALAA